MEPRPKTSVWKSQEDAVGLLTADQVYAMVGHTLFNLHQLEGLLKIAAGVLKESAKPGEGEIDAETSIWQMRRATLGKLLWNVRQVVTAEPGFSTVMARLLRRRNALAHNLAAHTPFSPNGDGWLRNVPRFLWALNHDLQVVHGVFTLYLKGLLLRGSDHPAFESAEEEVGNYMRWKPNPPR